jgi:hypothetical protein
MKWSVLVESTKKTVEAKSASEALTKLGIEKTIPVKLEKNKNNT